MSCSIAYVNTGSRPWLIVLAFISFFFILSCGDEAGDSYKLTNIGAIIDVNSRVGKEEKVAMQIAVQDFNNAYQNHKLSLHFQDRERDPLRAASAAEKLVKEKKVKVIIGMERWGEATIVADIGNRVRVPVLSLAEPAITPPLMPVRWPFLVRMTNHRAEQLKCIAALVGSYNWKRVIVIYEDDENGGDTGDLTLFSEALQDIGSEIECRLVLPPFSYLTNPKEFVQEELEKLIRIQSRVFIVLHSSASMVIHLFREAKEMGFVGKDSVWIISDTITNSLDSFNSSVISSMEGALGIKPYFSEISSSYSNFKGQFKTTFRAQYPEEDSSDPGIYALKAYDSIITVTQGINKMTSEDSNASVLIENILSSNSTGLSGEISFKEGRLLQTPRLRIINLLGKKYKELDFWQPEFGFSKSLDARENNSRKSLASAVIWPGDLSKDPKGWALPTDSNPLKIAVPGQTSFETFVKVNQYENRLTYDGFCIELFKEVLKVLGYDLPYEFHPVNGTYDELVQSVYNKTYDAVVGDVTIRPNRTKIVEFTEPYTESALSMVVPVKSEESALMFLRPFTWRMWVVTGAILIYTMLIVWLLENKQNPEFNGPLPDQISTALWFTFSSLFFAHRDKIYSNLTRVVVVVWLFVVLIVNSSYTASLSSMLTVQRLKPTVTDIEWLKRNNLKVGCDGSLNVRNYLKNVLNFKTENILNVNSEYEYQVKFKNNIIAAAFFELPYAKVFITHYCKGYTATTPTYRFAGLGFVFQKGSPIVADFSEAILKLSGNGVLKSLEEQWFATSPQCSANATNNETESLSHNETESLSHSSFWDLYLIYGAISTICSIIFLVRLLRNYRHDRLDASQSNIASSKRSIWSEMVILAKYTCNREGMQNPARVITFAGAQDANEWNSSRWEYANSSEITDDLQESSEADTEMQYIPVKNPGCVTIPNCNRSPCRIEIEREQTQLGGLGFVFQKGSPIVADFSKAILKLSENGVLKSLEEQWFTPSPECSANATNKETESLSLSSF
ncbi:hypothetical protein JRO89_XS06G0070100 [Xanthoceras sorbifolium]|uniref:Ionotropic glutamate receptor C-terminal domain-containing protein n=1 Tax=Xanthoceras sorbifolium TaxID=99658 RepID=A0ABQ8HXD9_9ROSI|nr:hypothetical protein JRO89_XS06G0070100 [Xanthoceras sorbifolium]